MKNKILTIFLFIQIGFVQFLKNKPAWVEQYYSNGIYPFIAKFFRLLFGWVPFSVGDLLYITAFIYVLLFIYKIIKNKFKNFSKSIFQITAFTSVLYFCFYFFWGLNYFRNPLSKLLNYQTKQYTTEQLITTTKLIVKALNTTHKNIVAKDSSLVDVPYSNSEIFEKAIIGYERIAKKYPKLKYTIPSIKNSLTSILQSYNGITGYLNPFTAEAQVNYLIPKTTLPATTCHEMAHQIGFAAENEANFIGFLAAIHNSDNYFKYSGYKMAFGYCFTELKKRDIKKAQDAWQNLNEGIKKDFKQTASFWKKYRNPIEPIIKKGYSSYLKANNQADGIQTYNYVVDLLIGYYNL